MTSKNRPRSVTWLAAGVLTFSVMQFAGLVAWFTLPDLPANVPKGYLLLKNGLWGSASLVAAMALFFRRNWAPKLMCTGAIVYGAWLWIDRLLLQRSDYARSSFPFTFGAMTLCFLIVIWILSRSSVRQYYEEQNE
ncbi:MAG: hypothetical protein WBB65_11555 [Anaerolineales bacterium]